jgi:hypothetical protein
MGDRKVAAVFLAVVFNLSCGALLAEERDSFINPSYVPAPEFRNWDFGSYDYRDYNYRASLNYRNYGFNWNLNNFTAVSSAIDSAMRTYDSLQFLKAVPNITSLSLQLNLPSQNYFKPVNFNSPDLVLMYQRYAEQLNKPLETIPAIPKPATGLVLSGDGLHNPVVPSLPEPYDYRLQPEERKQTRSSGPGR